MAAALFVVVTSAAGTAVAYQQTSVDASTAAGATARAYSEVVRRGGVGRSRRGRGGCDTGRRIG
ncbi:MAG: hypothetical protein M5U19_18995 [Microthrixaceae bacterium]|nr:hypothetical protein [Microthrixaceae bacterium]